MSNSFAGSPITFMTHTILQSTVSPKLVTTRAALRDALNARRMGSSIGFVPTMGALHAGHENLVKASREQCDVTVVSIFVNPTQFGPGEDLEKYPRTLERDLDLLKRAGADVIFAPATDEIYRRGHSTFVDVGPITELLEGKFRPEHFRGVATVVLKLLNLVQPEVAYFGRKDYQQTLVIRRMTDDLNLPVEIRVCPTVREADGLAMSSRNAYLSPDQRQRALAISRALRMAQQLVRDGARDARAITAKMHDELTAGGIDEIDYVVVADPETLSQVHEITGPAVALIAAKVGATRLIDNETLTPVG